MNLLEKSVKYLSTYRKTEKEFRQYLRRKNIEEEEIDKLVVSLKEYGYLDDRKFCTDFIFYGFEAKGWGEYRIVQELSRRGIKGPFVSREIQRYKDEYQREGQEEERALDLGRKVLILNRVSHIDDFDRKIRDKIMRKLVYNGYSFSTGYKIIDILQDEVRSGK